MVLAPRQRDVEYSADHHGGRWVIRTNADGAKNFKLVTAAERCHVAHEWKDWVAHRDDVFIEGFELFDGFTAIAERSEGLERLRAAARPMASEEYVKADEPAYSMGLATNAEPDTDWLRYTYTSLTTPATTYEVNTRTGERKLLKREPVIGYDPASTPPSACGRPRATAPRCRCRWSTRRASRRTARRRCCSTPTAATATRSTPASTCRW